MDHTAARDILTKAWRAGVAVADPRRVTRDAVAGLPALAPAVHVIALGKGSHAMAVGAVEALAARGVRCAGGLVIAHDRRADAAHGLPVMVGDHPVPSTGSFRAAERLADVIAGIPASDDALVLVSGGATSLAAGPVAGVSREDLSATFDALLASGTDIEVMNAIRKRILRWGAGRLAIALHARAVHCLIASDVIGNDPAFVASGPCVPDVLSASDVIDRAARAHLLDALPRAVRAYLERVAQGEAPETPGVELPRFATTTTSIILDRHSAMRGAEAALRDAQVEVTVDPDPVVGPADLAGERLARDAIARATTPARLAVVRSGETTVALDEHSGRGGRCQELALAAAHILDDAGAAARGITLLAAGTDGRDGPTDAAGAIVDADTWRAIAAAGFDPDAALRRHDAFPALAAAHALLRAGPTGTNVNDLMLTLVAT